MGGTRAASAPSTLPSERVSTWALVPWKANALVPHSVAAPSGGASCAGCRGTAQAAARLPMAGVTYWFMSRRCSTGSCSALLAATWAKATPTMPATLSPCPTQDLEPMSTRGAARLGAASTNAAAAAPTSMGSPRAVPAAGG